MIRIVQPAQVQSQKATHSRAEALARAETNLNNLMNLATQPGVYDMVVFPETTYPFVVMPGDTFDFVKIINNN